MVVISVYHVGTLKKISKNRSKDIGNYIICNHVWPYSRRWWTSLMVAFTVAVLNHLFLFWSCSQGMFKCYLWYHIVRCFMLLRYVQCRNHVTTISKNLLSASPDFCYHCTFNFSMLLYVVLRYHSMFNTEIMSQP